MPFNRFHIPPYGDWFRDRTQSLAGAASVGMNGFGPKRPLSADEREWQLSAFLWPPQGTGGIEKHRSGIPAPRAAACFPDSHHGAARTGRAT